jgi:hypothetical protein
MALASRIIFVEGAVISFFNTILDLYCNIIKSTCGATLSNIGASFRSLTSQSSSFKNPVSKVKPDKKGEDINVPGAMKYYGASNSGNNVNHEQLQVGATPRTNLTADELSSRNNPTQRQDYNSNQTISSNRAIQNLLAEGSSKLHIPNINEHENENENENLCEGQDAVDIGGNDNFLTLADEGFAIELLRCLSPQLSLNLSLNSYNSSPHLANFISPPINGSVNPHSIGISPAGTSIQSVVSLDLNNAIVNLSDRESVTGVSLDKNR